MDAVAQLNMMLAKRRGQGIPSAKSILDRLGEQGVRLAPTNDGTAIKVHNGKLNDEQRLLITQHRAALLDYLTAYAIPFEFWVPEEVEQIVQVLLIRMDHHDWPGSSITRRQFGHLQDEVDDAWTDRNLERLKRAAGHLHNFLDGEPFSMLSVESKEGHGGRMWYDQANKGLAGHVKPSRFTLWRNVCRGVPETDRGLLVSFLNEFKAALKGECELKVERVK